MRMWTAMSVLSYSLMQLCLGCQRSGEEILLRANCGNSSHNEAIVRGGWGEITHSGRLYSVKHKPFYHHLQTFQTNMPSLLYRSGNKCFVIFIPSVADEYSSQRRTRENCAGRETSPFLQCYFYPRQLFQVFKTIGQNGDGEMMPGAKLRHFTDCSCWSQEEESFEEEVNASDFRPTSCQWKLNCRP